MSFISSFKRALGFPGEYDNDDKELENDGLSDNDLVDDPDPAVEEPASTGDAIINLSDEPKSDVPVTDEELENVSGNIFDAVLNYFNSHQPELVRQCLDIEAQRSLIVRNTSEDLRKHLRELADKACRSGENRWAEKQKRLSRELHKLQSEYNSVRQQHEEFQKARLSATRQKRALNDRISDLESQVMTLEAEREQFQLENRSMAARLRALGNGGSSAPVHPTADPRIAEEKAALEKELKIANETLEKTKADVERLNGELEEARNSVNRTDDDERHAAETSALNREIRDLNATIERLQKQLSESAIKTEQYKTEIDTLNSTIEANISAHASAETELRKKIDDLMEIPPVKLSSAASDPNTPAPVKDKRKRKSRKNKPAITPNTSEAPATPVRISAIDELMDNTDWFVAPEPVPLKKDPEVEENFGYKEPAKKPESHDDDRQLTLW